MEFPRKTADPKDLEELKDITGTDIDDCYQCLKCTSGCPFTEYMDYYPHQVMLLAKLRLFDQILKSKTLWICASCLACTARCPRDLDPAKVMEGLRVMTIREREGEQVAFLETRGVPRQAIMAFMRKHGR